jgi:hypothetical protein
MTENPASRPRRIVFQYLVPVHVEVEDGQVCRVAVIDETPVAEPTVVEGDTSYLAEAVAAAVPGTTVSINKDAPPDKRSYQVDFGLFRRLAPHHQPQVKLADSIARLRDGLREIGFADADFRSSQSIRLKVLERHMETGRLDSGLNWKAA